MPQTTVIRLNGHRDEYGPDLGLRNDIRYIGRKMTMGGWNLRESDWANRFTIKDYGSSAAAVAEFEQWFHAPEQAALRARIGELRGSKLDCWCREGQPCHGLVLARFADLGSTVAAAL
jgi:hypothetical protein